MKLFFAAAIACGLNVSTAWALSPSHESPLTQFFHQVEGTWVGQGSHSQIDATTRELKTVRARSNLSIRTHASQSWVFLNEVRLDSRELTQTETECRVENGLLYSTLMGPGVPVEVMEVSNRVLVYKVSRRRVMARPFDVIFRYELSADGSTMKFEESTSTPVVDPSLVASDTFIYRRF